MKKLIEVQFILSIVVVFLSGCTAIKTVKLVNSGEAATDESIESVVPFTLEGHPILIKARVNNSQKEYIFLFDTGALTMISQEVAKELDLPKGIEVEAGGSGGKFKTIDLIKLDTISVGNVKVRDCAAAVTDFSETFFPNIAGILGSNFLKFFKVKIDCRKSEIAFSPGNMPTAPQHTDIKIPFGSDMRLGFAPIVKCEVNGEINTEAVIDTGYPGIAAMPVSLIKKTNSFKKKDILPEFCTLNQKERRNHLGILL